MASRNYRDLLAWKRAMDLVEQVYRLSALFPREEMYGLRVQLRRATVSVPSNIAEGQGRRTKKEFSRFLSIAHGSLREIETQVLIAERLCFVSSEDRAEILLTSAEVGRLITGLSNELLRRPDD
jgi:four helix bundle protein